ncbi:hypothetical protein [Pseudarthrobacter sp. SSS035]|uniref:hypothetical protein n=1 Tax=Pseudarthrobacter sp. SSS035 TaxID=2931399 RepID=UPI002010AAB9|nr:hypothetical protein [Pseudarthrobacter sp. SSS035]
MATTAGSIGVDQTKKVFVISPIGAEGTDVRELADLFLEDLVRVALPAPCYDVMRADEDGSPYAITSAMMGRLLAADFCVADISGLNPNVMYELALAHAAGKRVIIMTSDVGPMPFDIKDIRTITYSIRADKIKTAVAGLRQMAEFKAAPDEALLIINPVHEAFQAWADKQTAAAVTGSADEAMVRVVERLERKLDAVSAELMGGLRGNRQEGMVASPSPKDQYLKLQAYAEALKALENRSKQDTLELYKVENQMAALAGRSEDLNIGLQGVQRWCG